MKQKMVSILVICVSFLVGAGSMFVLMHDDDSDDLFLPPDIYGLPLSKLWSIVTDQTGVDNSTAILSLLRIRAAQDGSVESLILEFHGDDGGIYRWYHVEVNPTGAITWYSSKISSIQPAGTHPLSLLTEIEQIPCRELIGEEAGLVIEVDPQWGDLSYDAGYGNLFALDTGVLTPLKRVVFHTDEPYYDIVLCNYTEYESVTVSGAHSSEKSVPVAVPQNDSPCSIVFTISDLEKVEVVEYQ
ncbi:hypothetical protein AZH53_03880 [Methanomicrobiaceae archaeon CYW5]|uniref:hypothetical protein n=1 Tax=Methanovulcanius yangii TaxID=1789227 RepID=UPI0029CAA2DD|nr:hypothetical protein [Methanovulcanius yangii]MBT8507559.1 hypothetical protein [Methanovulcanius yangii]